MGSFLRQRPRVLIACGGTGGHLFPGLAVAEELRQRGHDILLLISRKQIDSRALKDSDWSFEILSTEEGLQSRSPVAVARFVGGMLLGTLGSLRILNRCKADLVLGMGGFLSFGPTLAGRLLGKPTLIHESNAIPGKANRLTARFATRVLLGFEECARHFSGRDCEVVGTPVRAHMRSPQDSHAARRALGLPEEAPLLLAMGGSQGAHGINELVSRSAGLLKDAGFSVAHISGVADEKMVRERYGRSGLPHFVAAFSDRMDQLMSAASVAVSRSGAASLAELAAMRLPALLIPYPHAAEDHQTRNAEIFVSRGAAVCLAEAQATPEDLLAWALRINGPEGESLRQHLAGLHAGTAHERVADTVERLLNEKRLV
ncbi:MAG: UDP-N-acetylglucosamine--N-acetylmuramyl-(pentapeptide) pyrophosphoryl-undecaprenol N-acetylglucosamine transferase [Verrucomicrobiia bacterium]